MSVIQLGELINHVTFDCVLARAMLAFHPGIISVNIPSYTWQQHSCWIKSFWSNPVWCPFNHFNLVWNPLPV